MGLRGEVKTQSQSTFDLVEGVKVKMETLTLWGGRVGVGLGGWGDNVICKF